SSMSSGLRYCVDYFMFSVAKSSRAEIHSFAVSVGTTQTSEPYSAMRVPSTTTNPGGIGKLLLELAQQFATQSGTSGARQMFWAGQQPSRWSCAFSACRTSFVRSRFHQGSCESRVGAQHSSHLQFRRQST